MQAVRPNAAFGQIAQTASRAFAWWLDELRDLVPDRLKKLGVRRRKQILLDVSAEMIVAAAARGQAKNEIARLPTTASQADYADMARELAKRSVKTIRIRLPARSALRKRITVPAALEPTLSSALRFELERQTPYNTEDVYVDHRVVTRHPNGQSIDVELWAVDRVLVDQAMAISSRLGLEPSAIGLDNQQDWPPTIDFMPRASSRTHTWTKLQILFALLAPILAAGIMAMVLDREAREVQHLSASVGEVRQQAVTAVELRNEVERIVIERQYLDRKKQGLSIMTILRVLTVLLPDQAWIVEFDLNGTGGRISGYASDASSLIGILDRSDLLANASFASPVVHDQGGLQRFNIAFDVVMDGPS